MKDAQQVARELGAQIKSLQEELRAAKTHFHLFNALRESIPEFQSELEKSPLFWSFTRHAHLQATVISICRIYDQAKSGSNLPRLLEIIQNNLPLFDREQFLKRSKGSGYSKQMLASNARRPTAARLEYDVKFCSSQNPLVATLKKWRDNAIAHKNYRIVLGQIDFIKNDPLEYETIGKLIDEGYMILNHYSVLFQGMEFGSFPEKQLNDYRNVLQTLKKTNAV
jgi:hypothetical protein